MSRDAGMPHSQGRAYIHRRLAEGKSRAEATRALKRHLSNVVYRALLADAANKQGSGEDSQVAEVRLEAGRTLTGFVRSLPGLDQRTPPQPDVTADIGQPPASSNHEPETAS